MTDQRKDLPPVTSPNFLEKVREALSVYLGNRGDSLDQGLTRRDLLDAGLVGSAITKKVNTGIDGLVIPGGGGTTVIGGEPEPDLTPPPTPTGFSASAAITTIIVSCDGPNYTMGHGHSKSVLYGAKWVSGALPVFANAVELTQFSGSIFNYSTDPSTTWHLWLKWVTVDNKESLTPAGGTNGVVVKTGEDVALLLEALTGEITASQLFSDLGTRINLIDVGPAALTVKVAGLLTTYGTTASAAASAAAAAIDAAAATQAKADAIIAQGGAANSATTASTKATESSTSASNAAGSASTASTHAATASTAATNAGNSSSAAATSMTNAATYATNSETSSTASTAAKVAAQSAQSAALGSANAASGSASTATTKATEASTSATSASTSATTATTKAADAAFSATNAATSETNASGSASSASTSAGVATTAKNNAGASATAAATSASTADTKATEAGTASTAATAAKVAAESAGTAAQGSATAASTSASTASTKAGDAGTSATAAAASATTASTKAGDALTYAGQAATSATTAAGSATTASTQSGIATTAKTAAGVSAAAALVSQTASATSETNAAGSASTAASTLTNINGVVAGAASAAVSTESTARINDDNKLFAQYTVKVDVNGYVSGYGLASTLKDGVPFSEFGIRADRFYIGSPGQASIIPFVVQTTPTTASNGTPIPAGVYIDTGYIKNATITAAQIGSVKADSIAAGVLQSVISQTGVLYNGVAAYNMTTNLTTGVVTATATGYTPGTANFGTGYYMGTLSGSPQFFVGSPIDYMYWNGSAMVVKGTIYATAGNIGGNTITSSAVSSPSFLTGVSGWALKSDGHVEFGAADIRGQLTAAQIDTRSLTIKNAAGVVIFGSGTALTSAFITADSGWLNSNVTPTTLGVVKIDLTNAPTGILNSSVTYAGLTDAKPPTDADKTSTHVAASVTGQGALATSTLTASEVTNSNVTPTTLGVVKIDLTNAPAGIVNSNVTYAGLADAKPPTDADKTSTHTAAGITGQGALATVDNVFVGTTVRFSDGSVMAAGDIVSRLSKMGSGNISTFVDGLAITNAYIGNAAISSAKIGDLQVNTVKIGANAVTVPLSLQGYSTLGPFNGGGSLDVNAAPNIVSPAQWLTAGSVVHVTLVFLCETPSGGYWTNCNAMAYMQLLNWTEGNSNQDADYLSNKGTPFFNSAVSVGPGVTQSVVFGGSYTIPHDGMWRIHTHFWDSAASGEGSFTVVPGYSMIALGAKK